MPPMSRGLGPRGYLTDEEKAQMPKVTKELLLRILSYLKPYAFQFILVFVVILVSAAIGLLPSIITGKIVDEALVNRNLTLLIELLIAAFCAMLVSNVIGVLENYINSWISQRIVSDMRNEMYNHLIYMPHSFFSTEKQGDIITRMDTDISGVSSVISGTLSSIVSNIATVVTTLVALFSMSPKLAIVGIFVIPLLVLPTKNIGKTRYELLSKGQDKKDEMNQLITETLSVSGSLLVKIFTKEEEELDKFRKVNSDVSQITMTEQRSNSWFRVIMGMFTQLGPLLIYFAGGLLIIKKWDPLLTVGTITATVSLINRLYRPIESLLNIGIDFTRSLALFNRIFGYLDQENTITSPKNGKKSELKDKDIVFEHVKFAYEPDKQILTDVNFTVPGGKMYAIVGPSGSGKSTIVNFIPRLYDVDGGSVSINGINVKDYDLKYLREHIGIVTQDTYLFNGTILDNLRYAKSNATDEEIKQACEIANIDKFISSLPDGYNTTVGNRGLKLSGGEKQRLSIARVILKNPEILILDEATSALDSISENSIQDALQKMMEGRTSLVIAHRLSTILSADKILVVKDGVIAEEGTHEELLQLNGTYRELYETQFRIAIDYENSNDDINIETFSSDFETKRIKEADIADVYNLYRSNVKYYRSNNERPSKKALTKVISEIPEGADISQKYFLGFYDKDDIVAILDLITGYPNKDDAFIGWFMVKEELHRKGVGSQIIADVRASLQAQGIKHISLECGKENKDAISFWKDQGFVITQTQDNTVSMKKDM